MMIDLTLGAFLLIGLLLLIAVLATARSGLVNSHPAEWIQLQESGVEGASLAGRVASESTRFLSTVRLAQSLLALATLWVSLATFQPALSLSGDQDWLRFSLLLIVSGLAIAGMEFIGEHLALRDPTRWALRLAPMMAVIVNLLYPFGALLLRLGGAIAGSNDLSKHMLVTEEQIMTLVDAGEEGGLIERDEKAMIYSIFQLGDTLAREVMVPRIDIMGFEEVTSLVEATETFLETGYSRAPVYRETIDNVIGLLYVKDLLGAWQSGTQTQVVHELMREAYYVPETKKVDDLLEELQARRVHMAIVVDEYGGTAGLVTIEDIVEEIIGEIRDEYDFLEEVRYQLIQDGEYVFSGVIDLDDVNQIADSWLPKGTSETLGGFIYSQLGRVPSPGDELEEGGLRLRVEQVTGRRIRKVHALRVAPAEVDVDEADS